jgi:hypothetical protein
LTAPPPPLNVVYVAANRRIDESPARKNIET